MSQPQPEHLIEAATYERLVELNRGHGKTLFMDVHMIEELRDKGHQEVPPYLPPSVAPRGQGLPDGSGYRSAYAFLPVRLWKEGETERVEGIESKLHGEVVRYERDFDDEGRLRAILKFVNDASSGDLKEAGAHYHVLSADHTERVVRRHQAIVPLGGMTNFDQVFKSLSERLLIISGDIVPETTLFIGLVPPPDLETEMLRSFVKGVREGAVVAARQDIEERALGFLDRIH